MNLTRLFYVIQASIDRSQIARLCLNITILPLILANSAVFVLVTFSNTLMAVVRRVAVHVYGASSAGKMR